MATYLQASLRKDNRIQKSCVYILEADAPDVTFLDVAGTSFPEIVLLPLQQWELALKFSDQQYVPSKRMQTSDYGGLRKADLV